MAEVGRFLYRNGVPVVTRVWRAACAFYRTAAADVAQDVTVARVVGLVALDGMPVAACAWLAVDAVGRRRRGGRRAGRGGGSGAVPPAGRCADGGLHLACSSCFRSAWRRRTCRRTWCRGWCGLCRGRSARSRLRDVGNAVTGMMGIFAWVGVLVLVVYMVVAKVALRSVLGVKRFAWVGVLVLVVYIVVAKVAHRSVLDVKRRGSKQVNTRFSQQSRAEHPHSVCPFSFSLYGWQTNATWWSAARL